jgi:hypothetical protein
MLRIARVMAIPTLLSVSACGTGLPARPVDLPPTPKSVTRKNPGGDAADPEKAALDRLLNEPHGHRADRGYTMRVPLFDMKNWQRVRLWVSPTRAAFQYGEKHYAFDSLWYTKAEGSSDPESCLNGFEAQGRPTAEAYGVRVRATKVMRSQQEVRGEKLPILVKVMDGSIESMFANDDYLGALVAYQSWPGTCLIRGFAVVSSNPPELAQRIRDRWVNEAAPALFWNKDVHEAPPTTAR